MCFLLFCFQKLLLAAPFRADNCIKYISFWDLLLELCLNGITDIEFSEPSNLETSESACSEKYPAVSLPCLSMTFYGFSEQFNVQGLIYLIVISFQLSKESDVNQVPEGAQLWSRRSGQGPMLMYSCIWKADILSPCRWRASFAIHATSMPIMMVQPCPSPKLNKLQLLERGNQI